MIDDAEALEEAVREALNSERALLMQDAGRHLRKRAGMLATSFFAGLVIGYPIAGWAIEWLLQAPGMRPTGVEVVVLHPLEVVILRLRIAGQVGIFLAVSILVADLSLMLARRPDITARLRAEAEIIVRDAAITASPRQIAISIMSLLSSAALALTGAVYAMRILIPLLLAYLTADAQSAGLQATWQLEAWIGFVTGMVAASAIGFQTPLVTILALRSGMVDRQLLTTHRRHLWFAAVVTAALLSPPDPLSLLLVATPIIVLFEVAVLIDLILGPSSGSGTPD